MEIPVIHFGLLQAKKDSSSVNYLRRAHVVNSNNSKALVSKANVASFPLSDFKSHCASWKCIFFFCSVLSVSGAVGRPKEPLSFLEGGMPIVAPLTAIKCFHCNGTGWNLFRQWNSRWGYVEIWVDNGTTTGVNYPFKTRMMTILIVERLVMYPG